MSFVFLTGFVQVASLLGPALTVASSGNVFKAGAQIIFDNEFKKKTGKSSLSYLKEEVSNNNYICYLSPDVIIPKGCFENIISIIENFKNFSALAPTFLNETVYKNYQIKCQYI